MTDPLITLYTNAIELSRKNNQTVGENRDYFVTLEQLEALIKIAQEELEPMIEDAWKYRDLSNS